MRNLFVILFSCLLVSVSTATTAYAQKLPKAVKKTIKANVKQFEKEDWSLEGTGTFESVLTSHHMALSSEGAMEIVSTATDKQSINLAKAVVRNNAINEYVEYTRSMVRARVNTDMADLANEQRENFVAGYERLIVKEIDGDIKRSFYLFRRNKKTNTYDVQGYFVVDEAKAAAATKRALQNAAKELEIATSYADKVSEFVKDGFKDMK